MVGSSSPGCVALPRRLDRGAELRLWGEARDAGNEGGSPFARSVPGGWDVVFCLRPGAGPPGPVYLDLNCVTDRSRWWDGVLLPVPGHEGIRVAAFRLPPGWRGTYRFHRLPGGFEGAHGASRAEWGAARRAGTVGQAPPDVVWPGAPFSPSAELALPDASEIPGGPLARCDPGGFPVLRIPAVEMTARVARIPGGRGTLVVLDGEQFLSFGLVDALRTRRTPPATVVTAGSTEDPGRPRSLGCDPGVRDEVLGAAITVGGEGPLTVAGASLGGAAALWWGLTRPDLVDGVVSLSGSFWMRDRGGRQVWAAAPAGVTGHGGRAPEVVLGWGRCEARLAAGCQDAEVGLAARRVRVTRRSWIGGHDFPHWVGEIVRSSGEARAGIYN